MAIFLALGSLVCAAVNDIVFRLYARDFRAIGGFMACIGILWAGVFAIATIPTGLPAWTAASWRWGLLSGLLSAGANVLLIEAMARVPAGTCATIYRLNLAPAAILAMWLFGEPVTAGKIAGLSAAVGAVVLVSPARGGLPEAVSAKGLWLVVVAASLRAGMGIAYKAGLTAGANRSALLALNGCCWIAIGLAYHVSRRSPLPPWARLCRYSVASGLLICGIVWFMAAALQIGDASDVLPVAQLSFLGTALIGWLLMGEKIVRRQVFGLALAVICIVLFAVS